ncbi:putative lipoprotein [Streptococcus mitis]|jgi:lipoprotein|uniref:Putative lipoprotein n=1 Tax=Streptococcus mitis TaxID=28037 RepID=A0A081QNS5_STRMT|nr:MULTISPECIES: hypothetical protein [Streptococcus]KEQ44598.1 putative lipoprotein [Streptococcus mitis]REK93313.1 hypothetical protein DXN33_00820 [Streptococcus sp. NM]RSJ93183.1 hypothetical protein D8788_03985 [Streptococcus mitis]
MKQRNRLLFLVLLFISIFLGACSQNSAQTEITGKGIVELINENRERVFFVANASSDTISKDDKITYIYFTKNGNVTSYAIGKEPEKTKDSSEEQVEITLKDITNKSIDEIKKLSEKNFYDKKEFNIVKGTIETDPSGNRTVAEKLEFTNKDKEKAEFLSKSLIYGQIYNQFYAGYSLEKSYLITEIPTKKSSVPFDKVGGKNIIENSGL